MTNRICLCLVMLLGSIGLAAAGDLFVPGQYASIQEAINAAVDGDRIVVDGAIESVAPPLVIAEKAVTIESVPAGAVVRSAIPPSAPPTNLIHISDSTVTLKGLVFRRDYYHPEVYDVLSQNSDLVVHECGIVGDYFSTNVLGGSLQMIDCRDPSGLPRVGSLNAADLDLAILDNVGSQDVTVTNTPMVVIANSRIEGRQGDSAHCISGFIIEGAKPGHHGMYLSDCPFVLMFDSEVIGGMGGVSCYPQLSGAPVRGATFSNGTHLLSQNSTIIGGQNPPHIPAPDGPILDESSDWIQSIQPPANSVINVSLGAWVGIDSKDLNGDSSVDVADALLELIAPE